MLKNLCVFLLILLVTGCDKKSVKPDPVVEAAMKTPLSCIKCRKTAPRTSFGRINQVLVKCPDCQKVFPFHKGMQKKSSGR